MPSASLAEVGVGLFSAYEAACFARPVLTKAATSGVAYVLGDVLAQRLAPAKFNLARVVRSGAAGCLSHGPQLHYWSLFLDRFVCLPGPATYTVACKILLDQTIFSLYLNGAYCALTELLKRSSASATWARMKASAWPMLSSSWRFWPAVHALTYSIVPTHLRVLWVDIVEVVWVAILSTCAVRAANANKDPHPHAE